MSSQVLFGVLWAITLFVVTAIAKWWKRNKDDEGVQAAFSNLKDWANIVVRATEDIGYAMEMTGEEKLRYAIRSLKELRDKIGIDITDEQVEMLVRAAYTSFCVEESGDVYLLDNEEDDFFGDANG